MKSLAIIGAGNMGGAIYTAVRTALPDLDVAVCDPETGKLTALKVPSNRRFSRVNDLFSELRPNAVLLAVKPQSFEQLAAAIDAGLTNTLVISIMAGIPIERLSRETRSERIIRSMPNLAAIVGKSLTGWIASPAATAADKAAARSLFRSFGIEVELATEADINSITALSGSGPAYYFYLTQLLEEKARAMGFSPADAETIAQQTIQGAAAVLASKTKTAKEWKQAVTSKGGTTEAALKHLRERQFDHIFANAIQKAKERAQELAG
ncbi:MAG: pyrroline-5-carboxylate reductase [Patescibacteria group bacterium]|nr:pyrroline-5-carboxylate reductase [Patescibacteria group bacterium]